MHPLVKVLTAPQARRQSTTDDPDDPMEDDEKEDVVRTVSMLQRCGREHNCNCS